MDEMGCGFKWLFTEEELQNTPTVRGGLSPGQERVFRLKQAILIQSVGARARMTQLSINTAVIFMQRFYMFRNVKQFARLHIAVAFMFAGGKVEESFCKLEHLIRASLDVIRFNKNREFLDKAEPLTYKMDSEVRPKLEVLLQNMMNIESSAYQDMRKVILECEAEIYAVIGFNLSIVHPHNFVVRMCGILGGATENYKEVSHYAYNLATASAQLTMMCLKYKPQTMAIMCLNVAAISLNANFKALEEKKWYQAFDQSIEMSYVKELTAEFHSLAKNYQYWKDGRGHLVFFPKSDGAHGQGSAAQGHRQQRPQIMAPPQPSMSHPANSSAVVQSQPPRALSQHEGSSAMQSQVPRAPSQHESSSAMQNQVPRAPSQHQAQLPAHHQQGVLPPPLTSSASAPAQVGYSHRGNGHRQNPGDAGSSRNGAIPDARDIAHSSRSHHRVSQQHPHHQAHQQQQQTSQQPQVPQHHQQHPHQQQQQTSQHHQVPQHHQQHPHHQAQQQQQQTSQQPQVPQPHQQHPHSHPQQQRPAAPTTRPLAVPVSRDSRSLNRQPSASAHPSTSSSSLMHAAPSSSSRDLQGHQRQASRSQSEQGRQSSSSSQDLSRMQGTVPAVDPSLSRSASHLAQQQLLRQQPPQQQLFQPHVGQQQVAQAPQMQQQEQQHRHAAQPASTAGYRRAKKVSPNAPLLSHPGSVTEPPKVIPVVPAATASHSLPGSGDPTHMSASQVIQPSRNGQGYPSQLRSTQDLTSCAIDSAKQAVSEASQSRSRSIPQTSFQGQNLPVDSRPAVGSQLVETEPEGVNDSQSTDAVADALLNFTKPQDSPRIKIKVKKDSSSADRHSVKYADTGLKIKIKTPVKEGDASEPGPSNAARPCTPKEEATASPVASTSSGLRIKLSVPKSAEASGLTERHANGVAGERDSSSKKSHHHGHHHRSHHKSKKHSKHSRHEGKSSKRSSTVDPSEERPAKASRSETYTSSAVAGTNSVLSLAPGGYPGLSSTSSSSSSLNFASSDALYQGFSIADAFSSTMPTDIFDDDDEDTLPSIPLTPVEALPAAPVSQDGRRFTQFMPNHFSKKRAGSPTPPPSS